MISQADIYLDTHTVVWLYTGQLKKFSKNTLDILENNNLFISPMVKLELQYLYEKQRITDTAEQILNALQEEVDLKICHKNWLDIVNMALTCDFTRDAFDRLIIAHAMLDNRLPAKLGFPFAPSLLRGGGKPLWFDKLTTNGFPYFWVLQEV